MVICILFLVKHNFLHTHLTCLLFYFQVKTAGHQVMCSNSLCSKATISRTYNVRLCHKVC